MSFARTAAHNVFVHRLYICLLEAHPVYLPAKLHQELHVFSRLIDNLRDGTLVRLVVEIGEDRGSAVDDERMMLDEGK